MGAPSERGQWTEWQWLNIGKVQYWVSSRHLDNRRAVTAFVTPEVTGGGAVCRLMHSRIGEDGNWQLNVQELQLVTRFGKLPQAFVQCREAVERKIGLE